jgi:hypothetical protein
MKKLISFRQLINVCWYYRNNLCINQRNKGNKCCELSCPAWKRLESVPEKPIVITRKFEDMQQTTCTRPIYEEY